MKFAREFRSALVQEGFPPRWVDTAVPYRELKKCLKKIQGELLEVGLDPSTVRQFLDDKNVDYNLEDMEGTQKIRPKLTITVHVREGTLVDAGLTPATRLFLERLTGQVKKASEGVKPPIRPTALSAGGDDGAASVSKKLIEVPLVFDAQFFEILQSDVVNLSVVQQEEEKAMASSVRSLQSDLARVVKPTVFHKDDMAVWREIFRLYLDANVFFSTLEADHGVRSSAQASTALQWWKARIYQQRLIGRFTRKESGTLLERFMTINANILMNLRFQELNQTAVAKILKKFDKHTLLSATPTYRLFSRTHHPSTNRLLASSVAKDMAAGMSTELVRLVPQIQDYLCPVCDSIASYPMKPRCGHIICSRCMNKMLRKNMFKCPMCRIDVTEKENAPDVDWAREKLNVRYFPQETREKHYTDRLERGRELYGDNYKPNDCTMM